MKTRRQVRLQSKDTSTSPLKKKTQIVKEKKVKPVQNQQNKPKKKLKKQKEPSPKRSPSPSSQPQKKIQKRGRRKKQQRVTSINNNGKDKNQKKDDSQKDAVAKHNKSPQKQKEKQKNKQADKKNKSQDKKKQSIGNQDKKKQKAKSQQKQTQKSGQPNNDKQKQKQDIKKVLVKGAAPVDEHFNKGKDFHVLVHGGNVYSATLNQTNISNNNNKFYNLQIIQSDKDPNTNYFFTRWGRVGTPGQKCIEGPFTVNIAISRYQSKFHQKHVKGQYRHLQLNYNDQQQNEKSNQGGDQKSQQNPLADYQQSTLPKQTKDLVNLIFDLGMMNSQMKQIGYDANKMPLGKLSKENIKKGYNILKELYDEIQNKKRQHVMQQLTNDFYSFIPHNVGFKNMILYRLDTLQKVKQKLQMLQSLAQIKIATEIIGQKQQGNRIDNNYKKLNRQITPIEKDSFTYKIISQYLQSTHAKTHRGYQLELVDLFQVKSEMESNRYTNDIPNKMLLWHGSRLTNFVGILSQGLRIAPPEAPVTGYMFGKGVYFADMSSKSANYCFTSPQNNTVALGNCNQKMHADYYASNLPDGKHSTKGVGKTVPKVQNYQMLDGVIVPMGPGVQNQTIGCSLLYNQFIVYRIEQIKIRYLLRIKFNYRKIK